MRPTYFLQYWDGRLVEWLEMRHDHDLDRLRKEIASCRYPVHGKYRIISHGAKQGEIQVHFERDTEAPVEAESTEKPK